MALLARSSQTRFPIDLNLQLIESEFPKSEVKTAKYFNARQVSWALFFTRFNFVTLMTQKPSFQVPLQWEIHNSLPYHVPSVME